MNIYWGDIHNHNAIGYGTGSLDRSYSIARGCLLDVYCFTPHGRWHDLPADDAALAEHHRTGFEKVLDAWPDVIEKANTENRNHRMVSFIGFEWHSSRFGDYHILLPGDTGEICAPNDIRELQSYTYKHNAVMIPHHIAYHPMWRGISWDHFKPSVSPVVDVFSEHGCSIEAESHYPMINHSMGGSQRSQTYMEQVNSGLPAGVIASTDNHHGHPASFGEGLAAIIADGLSRESILDAVRQRHTYAVTGDRIRLDVRMGSGIMGDILPSETPRELHIDAQCMASIDYVRIIKNGRTAFIGIPEQVPDAEDSLYAVRVEFGWDAMSSEEVTDWVLKASVHNGSISGVNPCFAGGDGSAEKINGVHSFTDQEVAFTAFTSRLNSRPTSSIVLELNGSPSAEITVTGEAEYTKGRHAIEAACSIDRLQREDTWVSVSSIFSSPRLRIGNMAGSSLTRFSTVWTDPDPGKNDCYIVKVQQKNGHAAWSSPIWCTDENQSLIQGNS